MRQALLAAGPPVSIYLVFWWYIRAGTRNVDPASRRFVALFVSGLFLFLPPLVAPVFNGGPTDETGRLMIGVSGVCALSMAVFALRIFPSRRRTPLILMVLSGAVVSVTFLHYLLES